MSDAALPGSPDGAGIHLHLPQLKRIEEMLSKALAGKPEQAWYTLEQAHARKYGEGKGVSLQSVRNCLALQPRGGMPDGWQSGRKVWAAASIEEWLLVDDLGLPPYLEKHNPRVRVPERIVLANARHLREYPAIQERAS